MTDISLVIGWKFNHQEGMRCKEIDGVMTIVEFPNGIPTQADQDGWTAEYNARDEVGERHEKAYKQELKNSRVLRAIIRSINDGSLVTGANLSKAALKTIIKANMNGNG